MKKNINHLPALFLFGLLLVSIDIVNIDMGGFVLKLAYVGFAIYLVIFAYFYGLFFNWKNYAVALILLLSFIPSIFSSFNIKTSIAFFAGTFMCIAIMLTFAKITKKIGLPVIGLITKFYRFSVVLTVILVFFKVQERGHFLFYEASYYAIALIPYYCLTFHKMFFSGFKNAILDIFFIFLAIALSQSVSMVLWCFAAFIVTYLRSGYIRLMHFLIGFFLGSIALFVLYRINSRVSRIVDMCVDIFYNPEAYLNILVLVGGNRLQRVFIAYEAFLNHPLFGVGLGALREFSTKNFRVDSFDINGSSASDFTENMNATNVFMELGAEAGIIGLIGFLVLMIYIYRKNKNENILKPFKIAFYITMMSLLIESSYLRPYVWALYGMIIGISSIRNVEINKVN